MDDAISFLKTNKLDSGKKKGKETFTVDVSDKENEGDDIPVVFEGPDSVKPTNNLGKSAQSNFSVPTVVFDQNKKSTNSNNTIQPEKDLSVEFKATGKKALQAYVNYGYGDETPKEWYGSGKDRQERLRKLKKKYDPKGRFNFFAPIA